MEPESLLLVLELDYLAGLEKALQSCRSERVIFHGPSKLRARTGKSIGHRTQVGVKASRFCVDQLLDRAARIVGEVLFVNSYDFSFGQKGVQSRLAGKASCAADFKQFRFAAGLAFQQF